MLAPASNEAWVLSTCSLILVGTAELFFFVGSEPVMATQMIQGLSDIRIIELAIYIDAKTIA
jgi:hypothetical protein